MKQQEFAASHVSDWVKLQIPEQELLPLHPLKIIKQMDKRQTQHVTRICIKQINQHTQELMYLFYRSEAKRLRLEW